MKRIHFVKLLFVVLLVSGSLNAWAAEGDKTTANFTSWSTSIQAYNATVWNDNGCSFTYASNNQKGWSYVRCGSKGGSSSSSTASGASTILYNTQFVVPIKMVVLNLNGISNGSSSSITITSVVIKAYSDKGCTKEVGTGTLDNIAYTSSNCPETIEITPSTQFPKDSYIKVFINWTAKGTKNSGLNITSINYVEGATSGSTETTYSVTFDAGTNGTCSTTSLTEISQGSGVTLPDCHPNTDYTFVGWATTSSATSADAGKAGEIYHPKENCTLYAVYSAVQNYTVTWVVGSNPSKTQSYTTQVASGSKATPPAELTLTGSEIGDCVDTFVGWSKSTLKSPTDTPPSDLFTDESPEAITANTTFNAVFARKQ